MPIFYWKDNLSIISRLPEIFLNLTYLQGILFLQLFDLVLIKFDGIACHPIFHKIPDSHFVRLAWYAHQSEILYA